MTSDVWAFSVETAETRSNYWRPMFVLWLMVNYRFFGLIPAGWHVAAILLHGLVIVLSAETLRRLGVRPAVSAATLWTFAAHPVHVESVAWISGAPDLLVSAFLLGSYVTYLAKRSSSGSVKNDSIRARNASPCASSQRSHWMLLASAHSISARLPSMPSRPV